MLLKGEVWTHLVPIQTLCILNSNVHTSFKVQNWHKGSRHLINTNLKTQTNKIPQTWRDPFKRTNYLLHTSFLGGCLSTNTVSYCLYFLPTCISLDHLQPGFHLEPSTKASFILRGHHRRPNLSASASMTFMEYFALLTKHPTPQVSLPGITTLMTKYILICLHSPSLCFLLLKISPLPVNFFLVFSSSPVASKITSKSGNSKPLLL